MQAFLSLLSVINVLLPIIREAVLTVETLFPDGGQGSTKLKMVADIVETAAKVTGVASDKIPHLTAVLGPIIGGMVSLFNNSGVFKTSPKPVTENLTFSSEN